jgi:hypothetical protein
MPPIENENTEPDIHPSPNDAQAFDSVAFFKQANILAIPQARGMWMCRARLYCARSANPA